MQPLLLCLCLLAAPAPRGKAPPRRPASRQVKKAAPVPPAPPDASALIASLKAVPYAQERLELLADDARPLTVAQLFEVLAAFSFPQDRLRAVEIARPRVSDQENLPRLAERFPYARDRLALRRVLRQR